MQSPQRANMKNPSRCTDLPSTWGRRDKKSFASSELWGFNCTALHACSYQNLLHLICPSRGASCQGGCPDGLLAIRPLTELEKMSLAVQIRCLCISAMDVSEPLYLKIPWMLGKKKKTHLRTPLFSDRRTDGDSQLPRVSDLWDLPLWREGMKTLF